MCNTRFVSTPPQSPPVIGDAILSAAYDSLCQVGASKLTIQRLADQANVSRMTVYRRFGDLDTVLRKVMTAEIVHAVAEAEAASTDAETARQRIGTAGAQVVSELATHPVFRSILSNDAQAVLPLLTERFGSGQSVLRDHVAAHLATGMASLGGDGSVREADPTELAFMLVMACQSFVLSAQLVSENVANPAAHIQALIEGWLKP